MAGGQGREPGGAAGIGAVGHQRGAQVAAVVDLLLEGEGGAHDAAVELGDGHAPGHVQRGQAGVVGRPLVP